MEIFMNFYNEKRESLNFFEKNLCGIIYYDFEKIQSISYQYGRRQDELMKWIKRVGSSTLKIKKINIVKDEEQKIKLLKSLTVEDFRGFQAQHKFELGKKFVFLYGRNGTGKSSFSEAIEYGLLNEIEESKYNRIDLAEYIKNIYSKRSSYPILEGIDDDGKIVKIVPNSDRYKFSIIERNRIENFARISAETNSVKQERLAALVGLQDWNKFVHNFSKDLNKRASYIDTSQYSNIIDNHEVEDIKVQLTSLKIKINQQDKEKNSYLEKYNKKTLLEVKKYLGEYLTINQERIQRISDKKNIDIRIFNKLKNQIVDIESEMPRLFSISKNLSEFKRDLSLRDFYEQVLSQQKKLPDQCPACLTKLRDEQGVLQVTVDPYEKAAQQISGYSEAMALESERNKLISKVKKLFRLSEPLIEELSIKFKELNINLAPINLLKERVGFEKSNDNFYENFSNPTNAFTEIEKIINENNLHFGKSSNVSQVIEKIKQLTTDQSEVEKIIQVREESKKNKEILLNRLRTERLKVLTAKIRLKNIVQKNELMDKYSLAYTSLIQKLVEYSDNLPIKELNDLDIETKVIYNLINKYDDQEEILNKLSLPTNSSDVIQVSFETHKNESVNALDVLSEGHIRVLGLSILLAKARKDKLTFIIFDDVVNSVDDDHRRAIAELITQKSGPLNDFQWIVTTHGREFSKQLVSGISTKDMKKVNEIRLLPKQNQDIQISLDMSNNYLKQAIFFYEKDDMRNCLAVSRREVEVIMFKLYKLFYNRYKERLSFLVNPLNPIIETRNVLNVLNSKFNEHLQMSPTEKKIMQPVLDELKLLLDDRSMNWFWLNKGTHEEEIEEFDPVDVEKLVKNILCKLDQQLVSDIKTKEGLIYINS